MKTDMFNKKSSKKSTNLPRRTLCEDEKGQIIVLMGITLALSVLIMGSLAAEIADLDVSVPQADSTDVISEFIHLKETFGLALNCNLAGVRVVYSEPEYFVFDRGMYDEITSTPDISDVFIQTSDLFRGFEIQHNKIFTASLISLTYSNLSTEGYVYNVYVELTLKDGNSFIKEPVSYFIVCKEPEL